MDEYNKYMSISLAQNMEDILQNVIGLRLTLRRNRKQLRKRSKAYILSMTAGKKDFVYSSTVNFILYS